MSKAILVMGESGSGKTTSCRTLDPNTTYYIDADGKGLSWKGWREQYNTDRKNYAKSRDVEKINRVIDGVAEKRTDITCIVIDTINSIMVDDEMRRSKEKNFDKWMDLASSVWGMVSKASLHRDDLTVIFMAHSQTERDDAGYTFTHVRTSGRKLDKIVLESIFTTVLLAKCSNGDYIFETVSRNSTAKSPMGAFETNEIPNDMSQVLLALADF